VIRELFKANNDPAILKASKVKRSKLEQKMKKIMGKLDANRYNSLDKLIETVWFRMSNDDIQYLTPTEAISQETKRRKAEKERREAIADVAVRKISEAKQEVKANRANITTFLAQNGGDAYLNKLVTDSLGTTTDIYGLADGLKQALINGQTLVNDMLLREYIAIAANEITTNSTLYTDETLDAETGEPNKQILLNSLTQYLVENADGIEKATEEREEYQTAAELTLQEVEMMIDENRLKGLSDGATLGIIKSLSEHYGSIEPDQVAPADEMTVTETHLTMMGDTPPLQRQITSLNRHLPVDQMIAKEEEMRDDYYVFYQAHPGTYRFLRRLNERLHNKWAKNSDSQGFDISDDFTWLRSPGTFDSQEPKTTWSSAHWVQQMMQGTQDTSLGMYLLSTNLSIFGNFSNAGESTTAFFLNQQEATSYAVSLFGKAAKQLDPERGSSGTLMRKAKKFLAGSSMMQIFVPKQIVGDVAFLSKAGGAPVNEDIGGFLDSYTQSPGTVGPLKEYYQARLIMSHEAFRNPALGVKMFEYSAMSKTKENEMLELIDTLVTDSAQANSQTDASAQVVDDQTPPLTIDTVQNIAGFYSEQKNLVNTNNQTSLRTFISAATQISEQSIQLRGTETNNSQAQASLDDLIVQIALDISQAKQSLKSLTGE
jgi:hypothetical protein